MSQSSARTVWFDTDRTRYFAIPDDEVVSPGALFLRSSKGGQRTVDADLVVAYEVPKDEAVRLMRGEFEEAVGRVKGSLSELFGLGQRQRGQSVDSDQVIKGLGKVFGTALSAVQETLTNPALAEEARERVEHARVEFKDEAEKIEPSVHQAAEKLREALRSPEVAKAIDDLGQGLQDLARTLTGAKASEAGEGAGHGGAEPLHPQEDDRHDQQGQDGGADHPADDGDGHGGAKL